MLFLISTILTTIINLGLGSFVFLRNPLGKPNIYFLLMTWTIVGWIITLFFYYVISDPLPLLFIGRLNFAISAPTTYFFYLLVYHFPRQTVRVPRLIFYTSTALTVFLAFISMFTPLIDKEEIARGAERIVIYGDYFFLWYVIFLLNLLLGLAVLLIKIQKSKGVIRLQLLYLLIGFGIFITTVLTTNILLPALGNFTLLQLGPLTTIPFVGFITYTIVKHRLLNIHLLLIRSLVFTLLALFVGFVYTFAIFGITNYVFGIKTDITQDFIYGAIVLFVALTYQPLRDWVKNITARYLYKSGYRPNFLHSSLNTIMVQTANIQTLMENVLTELVKGMHLTKGAIYIFGEKGIQKKELIGFGKDDPYDFETLLLLSKARRIIVTQEEEDARIQEILDSKGIVITFPVYTGDVIHGIALFGESKSGQTLTEEDIQFFEIFVPTFAVAIENAKAYESIKDFNRNLEAKVNEQTKDLRHANEHLKDLDKLKDEFVAVVSHELRTPMTVIQGNIWMALDGNTKMEKATRERLQTSLSTTQDLIALINDILDVSAIEGNRLQLAPQKIDIGSLIVAAVDELKSLADQKSIVIEVLTKESIMVMVDPEKIKQVLINLIGNAIKFTGEKGKITLTVNRMNDKVSVSIKDTGIGIKKEDLPKLFTKFGKLNTKLNNSSKTQGTGLGLYICKKIVELSGGTIAIESEFGEGTEITFTLPER